MKEVDKEEAVTPYELWLQNENGKKGSRRSPPRFRVRPDRNLNLRNDFMNGNVTPEEWKENFRMSERSFYILYEDLQIYSQG